MDNEETLIPYYTKRGFQVVTHPENEAALMVKDLTEVDAPHGKPASNAFGGRSETTVRDAQQIYKDELGHG